ncbi:MAG: RnfABCDGE type electron transport complex subunit D [Planctomycetota bacterium]|jgi:electron transport complex protein RnfD
MTRATEPRLLVQAAPFLRRGLTTPRLMVEVTIGLAPVVAAAIWFFGLSAILVLAAATAGAVLTEWLLAPGRPRGATLADGSAVLTGVILGLCLPPGLPLWMAFLGGVVAIGLGKMAFGGLGQNLFNPALVGRAFLQAAFPTAITTWSEQGGITEFLTVRPSNFAAPFMQAPPVDGVSTATPLGLMQFEGIPTELAALALGNTAGSLGETCAILIIVCGVVMALRRIFDWRIPVAMLGSVAVLSAIVWAFDREGMPSPGFMLGSGGLLFGAVYMATDPVTSPVTPRGAWIFGIGVGVLVVLIRLWGGLPEGVMYAILLMNAATPLIDRVSQPRGFGRGRAAA